MIRLILVNIFCIILTCQTQNIYTAEVQRSSVGEQKLSEMSKNVINVSKPQNMSRPLLACAPELRHIFMVIQKLPEVRTLLETIQKEGPIQVAVGNMSVAQQFGACWDPDHRIIFVNRSFNRSEGSLIGSILFELQNALINSKLNHLDQLAMQGKIGRDHYVESVERLEYQNSLNAAQLARKGIQMNIFPPDALLPTYDTFEEHYRLQKFGGHSAWIANTYNHLAPKLNRT